MAAPATPASSAVSSAAYVQMFLFLIACELEAVFLHKLDVGQIQAPVTHPSRTHLLLGSLSMDHVEGPSFRQHDLLWIYPKDTIRNSSGCLAKPLCSLPPYTPRPNSPEAPEAQTLFLLIRPSFHWCRSWLPWSGWLGNPGHSWWVAHSYLCLDSCEGRASFCCYSNSDPNHPFIDVRTAFQNPCEGKWRARSQHKPSLELTTS